MKAAAQPLGGPILTRPFKGLMALFCLGLILMIYRFAAGIGAVSALSDQVPWGIWIAFDVVTGTALACGGYGMAILVYALNRGRYHPLVRPAVLTSALGYTIAGLSLMVDTGRPWNFWRVPLSVWNWNLTSPLLEVALCIMSYVAVLWIELAPTFLERLGSAEAPGLRRAAQRIASWLERAMVWILALGMLLPTMHQSALGTLMILTSGKLHPLWQSPMLPLLFLTSSLFMGYGAVVFETTLATRAFGRRGETRMLGSLSTAILVLIGIYLGVRVLDLAFRGQLAAVFTSGWLSVMLLLEIGLTLASALILIPPSSRRNAGRLFQAAMLLMLSGGLYRFDSFLIAFRPSPGASYFPAVPEMLITFSLVALEIMAYSVIVKRFPIFSGIAPAQSRHAGVTT